MLITTGLTPTLFWRMSNSTAQRPLVFRAGCSEAILNEMMQCQSSVNSSGRFFLPIIMEKIVETDSFQHYVSFDSTYLLPLRFFHIASTSTLSHPS